MNSLVSIKGLTKTYDNGLIQAIENINLDLAPGTIYALTGTSGCGKSTLLNLIGTLDKPDKGEILYQGKKLNEVGSLCDFRRNFIGFVFQFHHLIPVLTLRENIEAALLSTKISAIQRAEKATILLEGMGISHRADSYANKISGGERQRGAIARALINKPKLVLADEPTGNVDSKTANSILTKMREYVIRNNASMLIATHDPIVASFADKRIEIKDGKII